MKDEVRDRVEELLPKVLAKNPKPRLVRDCVMTVEMIINEGLTSEDDQIAMEQSLTIFETFLG